MQFSIVEYYGKQNNSRCGYCKQVKSSHSHGMHAYIMTPQDYQDLIDRGWRRSGHYCYKPNMKITCCPCYTIKCDTTNFKLSKSHKKILKRMNKFLRDGKKDKVNESKGGGSYEEGEGSGSVQGDSGNCGLRDETEIPNIPVRDIKINEVSRRSDAGDVGISVSGNIAGTSKASAEGGKSESVKSNNFDESKPPRKKAKQMRFERKQAKLASKGLSMESIRQEKSNLQKSQEKSLKDFVDDVAETDCHKLKLKLVEVNSDESKATLNESYGLYKKYQTIIHNDPPENLDEYLTFLKKSPVKATKSPNSPPDGFGSFHQQYWLDEKLIAVGVIDILPHCVSSVYFFYDPDYSFLSLGTYGSLREIDFTRQLSEVIPSLKYYYMGFYIHSCQKMRYKGKLWPSYLLCPETYAWQELTDEIRQNLDNKKYQRLNADQEALDPQGFLETDLDSVLLLVEGSTYSTYRQYIQSFNIETLDNMLDVLRSRLYEEITGDNGERNTILEYGKLIGKQCAHRMLYVMA